MKYTYDAANRLISVCPSTNGSTCTGTLTTYVYNGDGDRVSQTVGSVATTYVIDPASSLTNVLSETTSGVTTNYIYGLDLVGQKSGSTARYFEYDGLGSVRQLTDSTGAIQLTQTFDPYGNGYAKSGTATSNFGYTGEQTDSNGFVYLRARYYQPGMGRFFGVDPSRQEMNNYAYVMGNPIMHTDPSGKNPIIGLCAAMVLLPVDGVVGDVAVCGIAAIEFLFGAEAANVAVDIANDGKLNGNAIPPIYIYPSKIRSSVAALGTDLLAMPDAWRHDFSLTEQQPWIERFPAPEEPSLLILSEPLEAPHLPSNGAFPLYDQEPITIWTITMLPDETPWQESFPFPVERPFNDYILAAQVDWEHIFEYHSDWGSAAQQRKAAESRDYTYFEGLTGLAPF